MKKIILIKAVFAVLILLAFNFNSYAQGWVAVTNDDMISVDQNFGNAVEIGIGVTNAFLPQNELLVQTGTLIDPYSLLSGGGITGSDVAIVAVANEGPNALNVGVVSLAKGDDYSNYGTFNAAIGNYGSAPNTIIGVFAIGEGNGDPMHPRNNAYSSVNGVNASAQGEDQFLQGCYCQADGLCTDSRAVGSEGFGHGGTRNVGIFGRVQPFGSCGLSGATFWAGEFDYDVIVNGDVYATGTFIPSDARYKENVSKLKASALDKLKLIDVYNYTFKSDMPKSLNLPKGEQIGVMSQELEKVFPNMVKDAQRPLYNNEKVNGKDVVEMKMVNYTNLIPVLIQSVKEVDAKVENTDELESKVKEQEATIASLKEQLAELAKQVSDVKGLVNDICNIGCNSLMQGANTGNSDVVLYQSIPNPTSGTAVIGYLINRPFSNAEIRIVSVDGKPVREFKIAAQGRGSIQFGGSDIISGSYNYSLYLDGALHTTKTIVVAKN